MCFFLLFVVFSIVVIYVALLLVGLSLRGGCHWLPSYIYSIIKKRLLRFQPDLTELHLIFCFVDHFEPHVPGAKKVGGYDNVETKQDAMENWATLYPDLADQHSDSDGVHPQHTWFFPIELYDPKIVEQIGGWCMDGYGELEVHLHHDNDTSEGLHATLIQARENFSKHGAMIGLDTQFLGYAFIHGNWALDNSHPEGRWCGVNDEISILSRTGCFADFTFPSAPSPTQPSKVNSIYYATDDPEKPKSHDRGVDVVAGRPQQGDLMIIQGPLCLNWKRRTCLVFPKLENAEVTGHNPPSPDRIDLWVKQHIHVRGRPEWIFVKVHAHGATAGDRDVLLGKQAEQMYAHLEGHYKRHPWHLHYVTAREMYNIVKAAEAGMEGNPDSYRDFLVPPYANSRTESSNHGKCVKKKTHSHNY